MQLENYFSEEDGGIKFSRQQASDFAKRVAGDFNPIHDIDAKRFCVPGDLLFAMALVKTGMQQKMRFTFSGMVTDAMQVRLQRESDLERVLVDEKDKTYLTIDCGGEATDDADVIRDLVCQYVSFSGKTFPHILVPLMKEKDAMINPERPMVIYQSMEIDLQRLDLSDPKLELSKAELTASGKRGEVCLEFNVISDGGIAGSGNKNFVLGGLRAFDQEQMDQLVQEYDQRKQAFM